MAQNFVQPLEARTLFASINGVLLSPKEHHNLRLAWASQDPAVQVDFKRLQTDVASTKALINADRQDIADAFKAAEAKLPALRAQVKTIKLQLSTQVRANAIAILTVYQNHAVQLQADHAAVAHATTDVARTAAQAQLTADNDIISAEVQPLMQARAVLLVPYRAAQLAVSNLFNSDAGILTAKAKLKLDLATAASIHKADYTKLDADLSAFRAKTAVTAD